MKTRIIAMVLGISMLIVPKVGATYITRKSLDESKVTIEGTFNEAKINRLLNVFVANQGYDTTSFPNSLLYNAVIKTDQNGDFSHTFTIDLDSLVATSNNFTLFLSGYDSATLYTEDFSLFKAEDVQALINQIAATTDPEQVKVYIESNLDKLSISTDYFINMLPQNRNKIYAEIAKETSFSNIKCFENVFYSNVLLNVLNECTNSNDCKTAFESLQKYILLDEYNMYSDFLALSDKTGVFKRLYNRKISDIQGLQSNFNNAVFLSVLEKTQNIDEVKKIIEKSKFLFADTYSKIIAYQYPGNIYSHLVRKSIDNIDKFSEEVSSYISSNPVNNQTSPNGGGGGGGNGGGISGSGNVSIGVPSSLAYADTLFSDINDAIWAKDVIKKLYNDNILAGYGDGTFRPNNSITREEFIHIVMKFYKKEIELTSRFLDVQAGMWYEEDVNRAYSAGVVNGLSENKFGVGIHITRQDAATILYRFAKIIDIDIQDGDADFSDISDISNYSIEAVGSLKASGILTGYEDGSFRPNNSITRAECCVLISKMMY